MAIRIKWQPSGFLNELHAVLGDKLEESADVIKSSAKNECPVKTGKLQESIYQTTDKSALKAYIGSDVEYSLFVEMGTRKMSARKYLRNGFWSCYSMVRSIFSSR